MLGNIRTCVCGHDFAVVDSRPINLSGIETIHRRRKCKACGTTTRTIEIDADLAKDVLTDD